MPSIRNWFRRLFTELVVFRYLTLPVIVGTLPNNIQNGQTEDAVPVMANYNWIVNQVNANAAALTLTPQLAGTNTFTAPNTFSVGATFGGAITQTPSATIYQWAQWNPSDIAGTLTSASSAGAGGVVASNYMSEATGSGTTTLTFTKAGNYKVDLFGYISAAAAYTASSLRFSIGGTAMLFLTPANIENDSSNSGTPVSVAASFSLTATAGQTLTILPRIAVTQGGGNVGNYVGSATMTVGYTGT